MKKIFALIAACFPVVGMADGAISRVVPTGGAGAADATGRVVRSNASVSDARSVSDVRQSGQVSSVANRSGAMVRARGVTAPKVVSTNDFAAQRQATVRDLTARAPMTTALRASKPRVGVTVSVPTQVDADVTNVRARAAVNPFATKKSGQDAPAKTLADIIATMEDEKQITDYCKSQYAACMDNFCNVLNEDQGRCSCSKNLKNYSKTEDALMQATEGLQDVAQQIQYIGLTRDEVYTLFEQTVAEEEMQGKTDNSQIKTQLDKIYDMVLDVKPGTASSTDTTVSMDLSNLLDFTFDSSSFDLLSMFGPNQESASISNQRGEQLYKTANARCKAAVLDVCGGQGVDLNMVTNSYDLEIDKACVAYERYLTESNTEMRQTVRNAQNVLQRARLLVRQQKNTYDLRGCVTALDSCMQDEFVCGADYENCLDPSGKYIVNGAIVVGSTPGQVVVDTTSSLKPGYHYDTNNLYKTWNYGENSNAWIGDGSLYAYIQTTLKGTPQTATSEGMSEFLQYKIGYYDANDDRNYGMCMSVLNKCQDVTYTKDGTYIPDNNVVREYLQRTLSQIKMRQDSILAAYAESCVTDVQTCLTQNGFDKTASEDSDVNNIPINACRQQIITCLSVTGEASGDPEPSMIKKWVKALYPANQNN